MMKTAAIIAALVALIRADSALAQSSPPVGNQFPVQATKTANYTIKQTDLRTAIPFNCSSPCTVTFPHSTSSWPKGFPVVIQDIGSGTVTISATTSALYGMPLTSGSVVLTNLGNFAYVTADPSNNYFASGFTGSGGGGGAVSSVSGAGQITVSPTTGAVMVGSSGFSGSITVASSCTGASCTPVTSCQTFANGILSGFGAGACSGGGGASLTAGGGAMTGGGGSLTGG